MPPSHWPNARSIADEKIHQEFLDVYTGLYASKERYVDIVKVLGSQFYGMTQKEISTAIDVKTGGTLTKMLENLMESGIIRAYPRYGKVRVETVYLCEMKFTGGKYTITKNDEEDFLNKIEAFAASKMHNKTHSTQLVTITTMGIARGEHASIFNQSVVLDNLFSNRRTQIF